ncbi:hypothetical protein H0H87_010734, partial [Tephrocybe sp. NHM501043]
MSVVTAPPQMSTKTLEMLKAGLTKHNKQVKVEAIGVLQLHNRMDLDENLNPQNKNVIYDNGTDQEIYDAVMAQHKTEGDMEGNGSDDSDDVEARLSCQEALLAASTL